MIYTKIKQFFFSCGERVSPLAAIIVHSICSPGWRRVWRPRWRNFWNRRRTIWKSSEMASSSTIRRPRRTISRTCWMNGFGMRRRRTADELAPSTNSAIWFAPPLRGLSPKSSCNCLPPPFHVIFSYPRIKFQRRFVLHQARSREPNGAFASQER